MPKRSRTAKCKASKFRKVDPSYLTNFSITKQIHDMLPILKNYKLPNFEQIINDEPFLAYRQFLHEKNITSETVSPSNSLLKERSSVERAFGHQLGVIRSKYETKPLIEHGVGKESHLLKAQQLAEKGDHPVAELMTAEDDLQFAATRTCQRLINETTPRDHK